MGRAEDREEQQAEINAAAVREAERKERQQQQPEIQAAKEEIVKQLVPLKNELERNGHWPIQELNRINIKPKASLAKKLIFYRKLHAISKKFCEHWPITVLRDLGYNAQTPDATDVLLNTWDTITDTEETETMEFVKKRLAEEKMKTD